jgi:hypothetical protein
MSRSAHALEQRRDPVGRADLADEVDVSDVDAEFARVAWWAVTLSSPIRSLRWRATRSAIRRVLTNTSVVVCSSISWARRS